MQTETCVACSKPLVEGGDFCPFCGTKVFPSSTTSAIDSYIQNKVNLELSTRLKDQNSLVREIGDKAEDIVWKRLTRYGILAGALLSCILAFIAFLGIKTIYDVSKRIEPLVTAAEQRIQGAKRTIDETASKTDSLKVSVDQLSRDVETQTKRVAESGGEISQKLKSLDTAANDAQKRVAQYQARSQEVSQRLEGMTKGLENRVELVSKQVDNVSIRRAYPNLGQQPFVTFDGTRWKDPAEKGPNERWVNIVISTLAVSEVSPEQLEKLMTDLKHSNFTPLLGSFGVGGPYYSGFGALGDSSNETAVFYFRKDSEQMAAVLCTIVSKDLSIKGLKPKFVDPAAFGRDDMRGFVIEHSGLDVQLSVFHSQK